MSTPWSPPSSASWTGPAAANLSHIWIIFSSGETLDPDLILGEDDMCDSAPSCWNVWIKCLIANILKCFIPTLVIVIQLVSKYIYNWVNDLLHIFMETSRLLSICLAAVVTVIVFVNSFGHLNSSTSSNNEKNDLKVKLTKRLPDAVIIGVKKCGTTTLGQFLSYHPSIAATGEVSFFENYKNYLKGADYYIRQMPFARYKSIW